MNDGQTALLINSVSGGSTSSFMYLNFPADISIFAMVGSTSPENRIEDKGLLREVNNRIPWFEGSMEHWETLKAVLDLEQIGGMPITWVASEYSFEQLALGQTSIPGHKYPMLPNRRLRFCTQLLKIYPIFHHCFTYYLPDNFIIMNIGFRADENDRVLKDAGNCRRNAITYSDRCDIQGKFTGKHRWVKDFIWREVCFPLYSEGITKEEVDNFMASIPITFPVLSNCIHCPFKTAKEHRIQHQLNPLLAEPWKRLEQQVSSYYGEKKTFDQIYSLEEILQGDFDNEPVKCFSCTD